MKLFFYLFVLYLPIFTFGQTNYFSTTISSDSDDAEENIDGGGIDLTSSDLEMVHDDGVLGVGSKDQWIGIRFTNIDIPENAIIDSAFIQFTVKSTDDDPAILQIHGEEFFNSPTFSDLDYNISSRPRTDTSIYWTVPTWDNEDESGARQTTPNLAGILSAIITQSLWQQGNAVSFIIEGSGRRSAFSHDNDSQKAARLHIYYRENTASISTHNETRNAVVYPNPSSGEFFVDLTERAGELHQILAFTSTGQLLFTKTLAGGEVHNLQSELKGYKGILQIIIRSTNDQTIHRQIIK